MDVVNLSFGKVLQSDTVNRRWLVQTGENSQTFVLESQLAGVEDLTKRRTVLQNSHAPDSSTALESFRQTASVGHLILVLRWCSQFQAENDSGNDSSVLASNTALTKSLAELSAMLLGTELSLRQEGQRGESRVKTQIDIQLARQILDLFGERSDFKDMQPNMEPRVTCNEGRLKYLLSERSWTSSRNQIADFIKYGIEDALLKATRTSEVSHKNRFFE